MNLDEKRVKILCTIAELILIIALSIQLGESEGTVIRYANVFRYIRPLSLFVYIVSMVYWSKHRQIVVKIAEIIKSFVPKYYCEICMLSMALYLALYQIYNAYCVGIGITSDSSNYIREATAIVNGYGFNVGAMSGIDKWFAKWPIGYPTLIAIAYMITGHNMCFASKILSIILVFAGMIFLYRTFGKKAWVLALIYCNLGFLTIYYYTWSENPFILFLIIYATVLSKIICEEQPKRKYYIYLVISSCLTFLMRYFGIITVIFTTATIVIYILSLWLMKSEFTKSIRRKIGLLIGADAISGLVMISYLVMNIIKAGSATGTDRTIWRDDYVELRNNLYSAIIDEIKNVLRMSDFKMMPYSFLALAVAGIILILIIHNIRKGIDYRGIFILLGVGYFIIFIVVRFNSSMDSFSTRFFMPGSALILIGLFGYVEERLRAWSCWIAIVLSAMFFATSAVLVVNILPYRTTATSYSTIANTVLPPLESIPEKTYVVTSFDESNYTCYKNMVNAFRADLCVDASGVIDTSLTYEEWLSQYEEYENVAINVGVLIDNCTYNDVCTTSFEKIMEYALENYDSTEEYMIISMDENN